MASYAYFCFRKLHILPSQFDDMDENEKAFVIACIRKWVRDDKKEADKVKREAHRK